MPIGLPPLRQRRGDIAALLEYFVRKHWHKPGPAPSIAADLSDSLVAYDWPGNVRELVNALERATIFLESGCLEPQHFMLRDLPAATAAVAEAKAEPEVIVPLLQMERQYIEKVLAHTEGKIYGEGGAAELLGLKPTTLQSRLKKHGLKMPKGKPKPSQDGDAPAQA